MKEALTNRRASDSFRKVITSVSRKIAPVSSRKAHVAMIVKNQL